MNFSPITKFLVGASAITVIVKAAQASGQYVLPSNVTMGTVIVLIAVVVGALFGVVLTMFIVRHNITEKDVTLAVREEIRGVNSRLDEITQMIINQGTQIGRQGERISRIEGCLELRKWSEEAGD